MSDDGRAAEVAGARNFGRREGDKSAATVALDFERVRRYGLQLFGAKAQVLFIRALFNLLRALRYALLVAAVGAGQNAVLRLEQKVSAAAGTMIAAHFLLRNLLRGNLHPHSPARESYIKIGKHESDARRKLIRLCERRRRIG